MVTCLAACLRVISALVFVALGSLTLSAQDTFTSQEGGFSVAFPDGYPSPKVDSSDVSTRIGALKMYTFLAERNDAACMVAYSDYPEDAFDGASVSALLDSARNGALNNVNGKLIKQKSITINGHPGRSVYFRGKSGGTTIYGRFDYYLVEPRLYQIGYMALRQKSIDTREVKNYFSSFRLAEQAVGAGR